MPWGLRRFEGGFMSVWEDYKEKVTLAASEKSLREAERILFEFIGLVRTVIERPHDERWKKRYSDLMAVVAELMAEGIEWRKKRQEEEVEKRWKSR
jgi:hypothetical protein